MKCAYCGSENIQKHPAQISGKIYYLCVECKECSKVVSVSKTADQNSLDSIKIAEITSNSSAVKDNINSPSHYTQGKYETIDVVRDVLGPEKFEGHCVGNILKYVFRYPYKNGIEDLKKAEKYLEWLIETKEKQETVSHEKT